MEEKYAAQSIKYAALEEKCQATENLSYNNFDSVNKIGKQQDDQFNYWMRFLDLDDNIKEMSSDDLLERIRDWVEDNRDKFDSLEIWQNVKDGQISQLDVSQDELKAEVKCFVLNLETLNFRAELSFFHS